MLGTYLLPVLMTFAWLASLGIATHNLVYDRQNGQEEVSYMVYWIFKPKLTKQLIDCEVLLNDSHQ